MLTKEQVIKAVNFSVRELTEIVAINNVGEVGQQIPIKSRKAIYREDNGTILAVPTKSYHLLPHSQIVETAFKAFDNAKIQYEPVKLEMPRNGAKMYLHLRSPEIYNIGDHGDEIQMETIITNSYDGSAPFGMELGGNRKICANGMRAYRKDFAVTKKHYALNTADVVDQFMMQVKKFKEVLLPFFQSCAATGLDRKEAIEFISALTIAKKYQKLAVIQWGTESKTLGANNWALYNALTYVATHLTKSYMTRRDIELRTFSAMRERMK